MVRTVLKPQVSVVAESGVGEEDDEVMRKAMWKMAATLRQASLFLLDIHSMWEPGPEAPRGTMRI